MVVLRSGAVSYERGIPVNQGQLGQLATFLACEQLEWALKAISCVQVCFPPQLLATECELQFGGDSLCRDLGVQFNSWRPGVFRPSVKCSVGSVLVRGNIGSMLDAYFDRCGGVD